MRKMLLPMNQQHLAASHPGSGERGQCPLVNYHNGWTMGECCLMVPAMENEVPIFLDNPSSFLDS